MSAYVIFIKHRTVNADELATYASLAKLARPGHDLKPLAFYGELDVREGGPVEGAAILEFPDMAAARNWYDSPAYQQAKPHRNAGADYSVLFVNGADIPVVTSQAGEV